MFNQFIISIQKNMSIINGALLYVNNMLTTSRDEVKTKLLNSINHSKFKIKEMETIEKILRIKIKRDHT